MIFLDKIILEILILFCVLIPFIGYKFMTKSGHLNNVYLINFISLPLIFIALNFIAYWPDLYAATRLEMMGYDFGGMAIEERIRNINPINHEEAIELENSNMGIGWPLKAIMMMFFVLPYPSLVYLLITVYKKFKYS